MSTQQPPKVTALVPAWNSGAFISRTLDSLAAQTYPNLSVLISDDASPDNTAEVCQQYVDRDGRFELVRQPENLGWLENTNFLLKTARADYLLFAFHDDVLLPEYIERCVAALEENPGAIVAFSDMVTFYHQTGEQEIGRCTELAGIPSRVVRARHMLWKMNHWWAPNRGVFRAEAARRIGGLRRNLAGEFTADWCWLVHMVLLGEAVRIPEVLVEKYYTAKSLSRGWNYSPRHEIAALLGCAREIHLARLTVKESLRLYATVGRLVLGHLRHIMVRERRVRG